MKNFPDRNPLDELEKRLQNYTEIPDELVWANIDAALRPRRESPFFPWFDYGTVLIFMALFFPVFFSNAPSIQESSDATVTVDERLMSRSSNSSGDGYNNIKDLKPSNQQIEGKSSKTTFPVDPKNLDKKEGVYYNQEKGDIVGGVTAQPAVSTAENDEVEAGLTDKEDSVNVPSMVAIPLSGTLGEATSASNNRRMQRLTFYVNAMPMLTFLRVIPASKDGLVVTEFNNPSILSTERFGISLNAGIQGYFTRRFEYYGGFSLYQQKQTLLYTYQSAGKADLKSDGDKAYTVMPQSSVGVIQYNMLNIGVHAGVIYRLYGKKLAHKIGGGFQYQQGLRSGNAETYGNSASGYLSYQLFYRNEISINPRLRFFIQPVFTQSIYVDESLDAPFKLKPYSAGIGVGLLYNLK